MRKTKRKYGQIKRVLIADQPHFIDLKGKCTANGCEAEFFKMGKSKWGIKAYSAFDVAFASYKRQKKAAKAGIGPQVGRFLVIKRRSRYGSLSPSFGFETQKAERCRDNPGVYDQQWEALHAKLRAMKMGGDFRDDNCGVIDGILVAVDFGSHSKANW